MHIDQSIKNNNQDEAFLRLTLESITAGTKIRTFDVEFNASLANLIVYHEQFIGKDNQQLRLLAAQLEHKDDQKNQRLVIINFLHTSEENPLFVSSTYGGTDNTVSVHFSRLVVTLQLEALLSILRFQDTLMKNLPQDTSENQATVQRERDQKKQQEQTNIDDNNSTDKSGKIIKKQGETISE